MDFKVMLISDYSTENIPRRATLQVTTDKSREFNAFLFPHAQDDKENNIVSAIGMDKDFKNVTSVQMLLQEVNNAPLSEWSIDTSVEAYL